MIVKHRLDLVPLIVAASGPVVTPAGLAWPLHRSITSLGATDLAEISTYFGDLRVCIDARDGSISRTAAESFDVAVQVGLLRYVGTGLLARWTVDEGATVTWRRQLLAMPPRLVLALHHAGKRWATLSDTILKNLDTSAASWAGTSTGEIPEPIERHP